MDNAPISNPNDFKVVAFHNSEEFGFTPDMGCMYDGKGINSATGAPGINAGETKILPYHVAHQLATNLAKYVMNQGASKEVQLDDQKNPIVKPIWNVVALEEKKNSYLKEMYSEERPIQMTEAQRLMEKVAELEKLVRENVIKIPETAEPEVTVSSTVLEVAPVVAPSVETKVYQDKSEVIAELEKRGITHDKRSNKATLEKLLA